MMLFHLNSLALTKFWTNDYVQRKVIYSVVDNQVT